MVAVSQQLQQCHVTREYWTLEGVPTLAEFVMLAEQIPRIVVGAWKRVDAACREIEEGHWLFVCLFQREGTSLEVKAAQERERLDELAREACVEGVQDESDELVRWSEGAIRTNPIN